MRSQPRPPEAGTWTKLGPSLDWHVLTDGCHGIFAKLAKVAFGALSDQYLEKPVDACMGAKADSNEDAAEKLTNSWHKVQGERLSKFFRVHGDLELAALPKMRMMLVTSEPLRSLTTWWMSTSKTVPSCGDNF